MTKLKHPHRSSERDDLLEKGAKPAWPSDSKLNQASKVVSFPHRARRKSLPPKQRKRLLLLQGPVGPFFENLRQYLEKNGMDCWRVSFNAGDRVFASKRKRIDFSGSPLEWKAWLDAVLDSAEIDALVLFGSNRPAHTIARRLARRKGVQVISLEEGYIRPGFVTIEMGGNNADSPVAGQLPPESFEDEADSPTVGLDYRSFRTMCVYGARYYSRRTLFSAPRERHLFHRPIGPLSDSYRWAKNYYRRLAGRLRDFTVIERLLERYDKQYFLVPLQVAADGQMGSAALGWSNVKLIGQVLRSFAKSALPNQQLVFKVHPLERGHSEDRTLIMQTAEALGIRDRVCVIENGSLGLLTRHAAGMITINSTSGLSAIFHGIPLAVLGNAIYANEALATLVRSQAMLDDFWHGGVVGIPALRRRYLAWLRVACLRPGDYYAVDGIVAACQGVLGVLREVGSANIAHPKPADVTPLAAGKSKRRTA